MCQLKSGIILKDRVFIPDDYNSHDQMLRELGIADTQENAMRRFVRAELVPPEITADAMEDVTSWEFNVDQDILPGWFEEDTEKYIEMMREAVKKWVDRRCIFCGSIDIQNGNYYAFGDAKAHAYGSTKVEAYDRATVLAFDNTTVEAYDSSIVRVYDHAKVLAYDGVTVAAHDHASVNAYGEVTAMAYNDTIVAADDNSSVSAYGSSTVVIKKHSLCKEKSLKIADNAVIVNHRDKRIVCNADYKVTSSR